jgi:hypothetical protein
VKCLVIGGLAALASGLTGCSATGGAGATTGTIPVPQPSDLRVEVLVTSKQCLAPSMCIYGYDVTLWPNTGYPPQPDGRRLIVIYTVVGGDQEQIGSFTVEHRSGHGDVTREKPGPMIAPDGTVLTATVTRVIAGSM